MEGGGLNSSQLSISGYSENGGLWSLPYGLIQSRMRLEEPIIIAQKLSCCTSALIPLLTTSQNDRSDCSRSPLTAADHACVEGEQWFDTGANHPSWRWAERQGCGALVSKALCGRETMVQMNFVLVASAVLDNEVLGFILCVMQLWIGKFHGWRSSYPVDWDCVTNLNLSEFNFFKSFFLYWNVIHLP